MAHPTATLVKTLVCTVPDGTGTQEAAVYRMDPPMEGYDHVVASARHWPGLVKETYLFGCDEEGNFLCWSELYASQKGVLDHHLVLADAGYEVVGASVS